MNESSSIVLEHEAFGSLLFRRVDDRRGVWEGLIKIELNNMNLS